MSGAASAPVVVTGLPRSGTTWLARELARAPGTALTGREPMNPRGRQFALQGSLPGWVRLDGSTTVRQRRTLRRVYRGWEPRVYSRYGTRQWAAPLPWVRVIVKDPFALLSLPTVTRTTGARPVIVFRHPGALLASYRRMGWRPDVAEIDALGLPALDPPLPVPRGTDDVAAMGWFWAICHAVVLRDLPELPGAVVVSHAELAAGGSTAMSTVLAAVGLRDAQPSGTTRPRASAVALRSPGARPRLHDLDRAPADVADAWRRHVSDHEVERIEDITAPVRAMLNQRRTRLASGHAQTEEVS